MHRSLIFLLHCLGGDDEEKEKGQTEEEEVVVVEEDEEGAEVAVLVLEIEFSEQQISLSRTPVKRVFSWVSVSVRANK